MYPETCTLPPTMDWEKLKYKGCRTGKGRSFTAEGGFWCKHCGAYVYTLPWTSGVQNRNHCPFCLWSRHLDHYQAGDRLSACKARMQPIGLTVKQTHNKYAGIYSGELMVIHRCADCGKLSINRLAADDLVEVVTAVYHASLDLDEASRRNLDQAGIHPLLEGDEMIVNCQLYGMLNPD